MAKDRLVVDAFPHGGYCVGWYLAEEQEMGLLLGEAWSKNRRTKDRTLVKEDEFRDLGRRARLGPAGARAPG